MPDGTTSKRSLQVTKPDKEMEKNSCLAEIGIDSKKIPSFGEIGDLQY